MMNVWRTVLCAVVQRGVSILMEDTSVTAIQGTIRMTMGCAEVRHLAQPALINKVILPGTQSVESCGTLYYRWECMFNRS